MEVEVVDVVVVVTVTRVDGGTVVVSTTVDVETVVTVTRVDRGTVVVSTTVDVEIGTEEVLELVLETLRIEVTETVVTGLRIGSFRAILQS